MIVLDHVSCRLSEHTVLEDVSLTLTPGCVALIGPNGAGKSTLLHLLADGGRYLRHAHISGSCRLDDRALRDIAPLALARRRAFLPQQHADNLQLPVRDLLCLAAWPHGGRADATALYQEALHRWTLEPLADRPWQALSGGERQRAQLARTWMQMRLQADPTQRLWLLDEPQNALDLPHQQQLHERLRAEAEAGALVVFSTHDINFALRTADRILALSRGQLQADGSPDTIAGTPADTNRLGAIFGVPFTRLTSPADGRPWLIPG